MLVTTQNSIFEPLRNHVCTKKLMQGGCCCYDFRYNFSTTSDSYYLRVYSYASKAFLPMAGLHHGLVLCLLMDVDTKENLLH